MEFFDWINVVQIFTEYFTVATVSSAAEYVQVVLRILYISVGVAGGLYLICLILGGLGMHTMAKKVGMKHSWLAFLPLANTWYAGKLAGETRLFGQKMKRAGCMPRSRKSCTSESTSLRSWCSLRSIVPSICGALQRGRGVQRHLSGSCAHSAFSALAGRSKFRAFVG